MSTLARCVFTALLLAAVVPSFATAQWSLSLAVGAERYWGGSDANVPDQGSIRPYRPTTFLAGLQRQAGQFGGVIRLKYMEAGMAAEGSEAVAAIGGIFTTISVSPEIRYRLATLGQVNQLWVEAGPLVEFWDLVGEDMRVRAGALGGLAVEIPIGGKFALSLTADLAVVSTPFTRSELDASYDLRPLWRRGIAGGLQYRL